MQLYFCNHFDHYFLLKVFGTNTTDKAVENYEPDVNGNPTGGTRTCYVVQFVHFNQVLVKFKSQDNNDRLEFDLEYFNKVLDAWLSTC